MAENSDCLTKCAVCSEAYTETGKHFPKLLPCHHTVCLNCIKSKLCGNLKNIFDCPKCDTKHEFDTGVENIPQNEYILEYLKNRRIEKEIRRMCNKHGMELTFCCRNCEVPICVRCLLDDHKNHNLDELQNEELRNNIFTQIESLQERLQAQRERLLKFRQG